MSAPSDDTFRLTLSPDDCALIVVSLVHSAYEHRNLDPKAKREYDECRARVVEQINAQSREQP